MPCGGDIRHHSKETARNVTACSSASRLGYRRLRRPRSPAPIGAVEPSLLLAYLESSSCHRSKGAPNDDPRVGKRGTRATAVSDQGAALGFGTGRPGFAQEAL